ncbi:hypothetical protein AB0F20_20685 [Streptomyces goshikiensis]|uniref:hypothetical protein n=1 Tax=Streptomyces goshikiensis TaxID=1942 RepID=UPI0033D471E7
MASTATLSRLFSGTSLPSPPVVEATVEALVAGTSTPEDELLAVQEVMASYHRAREAREALGGQRPGRRPLIVPGPEGRLQEELWSLIRLKGFTLTSLAGALHFSKSRLSEIFRQPHRLSDDLVYRLADVCQVPPEPLLRAVGEAAAEAEAREREAAGLREEAAPPPVPSRSQSSAAPDGAGGGDVQDVAGWSLLTPAREKRLMEEELRLLYEADAQSRAQLEAMAREVTRAREQAAQAQERALVKARARDRAEHLVNALIDAHAGSRWQDAATPAEAFVQAVADWPPGDIATVVLSVRAKGHTEFAARLVQEAVKTRSVPDVTALALALLDAGPAPAAEGTVPHQVPRSAAGS